MATRASVSVSAGTFRVGDLDVCCQLDQACTVHVKYHILHVFLMTLKESLAMS